MHHNLFDFQLGCFKSWEKIKNEFDIPDVMILKWHGLVMALPREWKNTIAKTAPENLSNDLNVRIVLDGKAVLLKDLKTKNSVQYFCKRNTQESNCSRKYLQKAKHRNNKLGRNLHFNKENHN